MVADLFICASIVLQNIDRVFVKIQNIVSEFVKIQNIVREFVKIQNIVRVFVIRAPLVGLIDILQYVLF